MPKQPENAADARRKYGTEKEFARAVIDLAHLYHWAVLRTWLSLNSPDGEPDLRLIRPPRVIFAELKTDKGKVTPDQDRVLALLRRCPGVETYLWRPDSWDEIQRVLEAPTASTWCGSSW